jgi:hypothetical protein
MRRIGNYSCKTVPGLRQRAARRENRLALVRLLAVLWMRAGLSALIFTRGGRVSTYGMRQIAEIAQIACTMMFLGNGAYPHGNRNSACRAGGKVIGA